jgi:hypothetical protein
MFGHLRLLGSGTYPALLVPDAAVVTDQTRQVVYVVNAHGQVAERMVTTGTLVGNLRVIREGLRPDDMVIIDGLQRVRPGKTVRTRTEQIPPTTESPTGAAMTIEPVASVAVPAGSSR